MNQAEEYWDKYVLPVFNKADVRGVEEIMKSDYALGRGRLWINWKNRFIHGDLVGEGDGKISLANAIEIIHNIECWGLQIMEWGKIAVAEAKGRTGCDLANIMMNISYAYSKEECGKLDACVAYALRKAGAHVMCQGESKQTLEIRDDIGNVDKIVCPAFKGERSDFAVVLNPSKRLHVKHDLDGEESDGEELFDHQTEE